MCSIPLNNLRHYESCLVCPLAVALLAATGAAQLLTRIDNKNVATNKTKKPPFRVSTYNQAKWRQIMVELC